MAEKELMDRFEMLTRNVSRRRILQGMGIAALTPVVGGLLAACGTDDDDDDVTPDEPAVDPDDDDEAPTPDDTDDTDDDTEPADPSTGESARDTVVFGSHQAGTIFINVLYTQGGSSLSAAKLSQRGLLFLDEDSNWIGELATEVPSLENGGVSEDGMTVTFNLREGVTWHDGEPVTSDDVKATWEMIMNPDNAVITRFGYDQIESVDTPDDHTVVLNFRELFASWPILFDAIAARHVIEANSPGLDDSEAMRLPMGFGPYKILEWSPDEHIIYEAFDDYWQGAPMIKNFIHRFYVSVDTLMQALEAGDCDIGWALPTAYVPQIEALEGRGVTLVTAQTPNAERYVMNADPEKAPMFAERELRVALHHAIDRQEIVDELLLGLTNLGVSEWHGSPWEHPNLPEYEYDPDLASEMLDDLGWVVGSDGVRERDGERLSFIHATTSGNLLRENVQLLVQQMFGDIGVEMVIENQRTADLFATYEAGGVWSRGEYEMGGWSHGLRVPDPEVSNRFLCSEIASDDNPAGSQWYHYCNPEVDELLLQQAQTFDFEERTEILYRVQEILHEDAYHIWLYGSPTHYAVPAALENFHLHTFANYYWNVHEWWFSS